MTLSDRLAAAAKARGEAERSDRHEQQATAVQPRPAPAGPRTRVLAGPSTPASAVIPDPAATPGSVCPSCGRTGALGLVDLPGRTTDWSCLTCGTLWQVVLPAPAE